MEAAPAGPRYEAIDHDDLLGHEWRVTQLTRLGIPWSLAQAAADGLAEGTTNIRIYGTPSQAILEMLSQAAGSGVPMTALPEHLGGFTR